MTLKQRRIAIRTGSGSRYVHVHMGRNKVAPGPSDAPAGKEYGSGKNSSGPTGPKLFGSATASEKEGSAEMSIDTKPKNLGGGVTASLDADGAYVQIGGRNSAILLTPDQCVVLKDWLTELLKGWRHE